MTETKKKVHTQHSSPGVRLWWQVLKHRHPKYWLLGVVLMLCHLLGRLPNPALLWVGRRLGRLAMFSSRLKHICASNINTCFPHLSATEQDQLVRSSFRELGMSITESFKAWFDDPVNIFGSAFKVDGRENLEQAMATGKGIILVSCHCGCLDLNVAMIASLVRGERAFAYTYRQPSDPVVDSFIRESRVHLAGQGLSVRNLVGISRVLKKKGIVWYAPDIEVHNKNTVFVDFMGVPASTTQAVSRIAFSTDALVVPFGHYRSADNRGYELKIWPAIENVPSPDATADTAAINRSLSEVIRRSPESYWWIIKRFKHRPVGASRVY